MIKGIGFTYEKFNFPCGEMHVRVTKQQPPQNYCDVYGGVDIEFDFEKNEDIIELLLICDALKRDKITLHVLWMGYVPFGRQDRVAVKGESFSLKVFTDLINGLKAEEVRIIDPHSDVTIALLNNVKVFTQDNVFIKYFNDRKNYYLISPDGGALKKIYKLAERINSLGVIECSKRRNVKTGEITGVNVYTEGFNGEECVIVDDICDGGRTFVEIAKVLKKLNAGKIILMVTHGKFTKSLDVFKGLIDEIYTKHGRVL